MSKVLRWIFKPYVEDFVSPYVHSGVGYSGLDHDLWNGESPRLKHRGVGYSGVYDE